MQLYHSRPEMLQVCPKCTQICAIYTCEEFKTLHRLQSRNGKKKQRIVLQLPHTRTQLQKMQVEVGLSNLQKTKQDLFLSRNFKLKI